MSRSQPPPASARRVSYAPPPSIQQASYAPIIESVDHVIHDTGLRPVQLPENMTSDDFTRAVAVATVSALRHQQAYVHTGRSRNAGMADATEVEEAGGHGGHDAPSWSRVTSASVLLACTALYAIIAGQSFSFFSAVSVAHRVLQSYSLTLSTSSWKALESTRSSWERRCLLWSPTQPNS